jgi:nitrite reductase/ring-hydroxylating ferredoxin subunit
MLCAALIPATMLYYCAEDNSNVEVFETEANLQEGETKTIQVGPKEDDLVLLVKQDGKYYCLQNKCSHYGFPLNKGLVVGGLVICPLHNATFDVKTGQAETGPVYAGS